MRPRRSRLLLAALAAGATLLLADEKPLPVSEDRIVQEMEALIDRAAPPKDKDLAEARKLVQKGVRAHDENEFEKAIDSFHKALALDPLNDVAYYEMALTYSAMGDQTRALDAVIRALTVNPKSEMSYVLKGNILDNMGSTEKAKETYTALLKVQPNSYQGLIELGTCQLRQGEVDDAEASYKKASEVDPNRPSAWVHLGYLAAEKGWEYDERRYFEKFLAVGQNDRRAEMVRKTLAELDKTTINMDPSAPFASIDLIVSMARVTWRQKHRKEHPDAHGYALTFEEENAIDETLILPQWREQKKKDPKAAQPYYDLLLRVSDAGFLDEYIYYTRRQAIGADATTWLSKNPERVQAFEAWARKEGLMKEESPAAAAKAEPVKEESPTAAAKAEPVKEDGPTAAKAEPVKAAPEKKEPEASGPDPVDDSVKTMIASSRSYKLGTGTADDAARFRKDEKARFAKSLKLSGSSTVSCPKDVAAFRALAQTDLTPFLQAVRCALPGDEVYAEARRTISTLGQRMHELDVNVRGGVFLTGKDVDIKMEKPAWLAYLNAKAVWRMEPELRARWHGEAVYKPSVEEEMFAWAAGGLGYARMRAASKEPRKPEDAKEEPFEADPVMERAAEIVAAGQLRGFVLYEVLHKTYGLSLASLSDEDARAVETYVRKWVFEKAGDKS